MLTQVRMLKSGRYSLDGRLVLRAEEGDVINVLSNVANGMVATGHGELVVDREQENAIDPDAGSGEDAPEVGEGQDASTGAEGQDASTGAEGPEVSAIAEELVSVINGIGPATTDLLAVIGIESVGDLLERAAIDPGAITALDGISENDLSDWIAQT